MKWVMDSTFIPPHSMVIPWPFHLHSTLIPWSFHPYSTSTLPPPGYSPWNGYGMDGIHKIGYGFHLHSIVIPPPFHLHYMVIPSPFHLHSTPIPPSFHPHSTLIPWSFHFHSTPHSMVIPYGIHGLHSME